MAMTARRRSSQQHWHSHFSGSQRKCDFEPFAAEQDRGHADMPRIIPVVPAAVHLAGGVGRQRGEFRPADQSLRQPGHAAGAEHHVVVQQHDERRGPEPLPRIPCAGDGLEPTASPGRAGPVIRMTRSLTPSCTWIAFQTSGAVATGHGSGIAGRRSRFSLIAGRTPGGRRGSRPGQDRQQAPRLPIKLSTFSAASAASPRTRD